VKLKWYCFQLAASLSLAAIVTLLFVPFSKRSSSEGSWLVCQKTRFSCCFLSLSCLPRVAVVSCFFLQLVGPTLSFSIKRKASRRTYGLLARTDLSWSLSILVMLAISCLYSLSLPLPVQTLRSSQLSVLLSKLSTRREKTLMRVECELSNVFLTLGTGVEGYSKTYTSELRRPPAGTSPRAIGTAFLRVVSEKNILYNHLSSLYHTCSHPVAFLGK
jgi:hypothetical protein